MKFRREIFFYKSYFKDFYDKQDHKVQIKINWALGLVRDLENIPSKYFKHIENTDGIYEIRVRVARNIFRIFCFFDEGRLVVILHGFQKKTQKLPKSQIDKAIKLRKEYYNEKE
jgi:phage-related protein